MILKDLPIVTEILCCEYGGWIIGSAANPDANVDSVNDIDIIVPFDQWRKVSKIAASHGATLNKHGGSRFLDENVEIDVWPDTLDKVMVVSKWAWQPLLDIRLNVFVGDENETKQRTNVEDSVRN